MKLITQSVLFWKRAQEISKEEAYHNWVRLLLPTATLSSMFNIIDAEWHENYFKITDFLPALYKEINTYGLWSLINKIKNNVPQQKDKDIIINYILNRNIEEPYDVEGNDDYFVYEDENISPELLRKAQTKIIKSIYALYDLGDNKSLIYILRTLLKKSRKLPQDFLIKLIKHFGPDIYVEVTNQTELAGYSRQRDLIQKEKLNIFDVASLWANQVFFDIHDFMKVIEKADDKAKQYMRTYLYISGLHDDAADSLAWAFMLSEDMTPMNIEYKTIAWPSTLVPFSLSVEKPFSLSGEQLDYEDEMKARWQQIFDEFNIIPH